jgi:hypothetical protein
MEPHFSGREAGFFYFFRSLCPDMTMNHDKLLIKKRRVMSLGPEAYVEEPEKLRDRVKADMKKSLVQYEGIKPALMENRSHSASE